MKPRDINVFQGQSFSIQENEIDTLRQICKRFGLSESNSINTSNLTFSLQRPFVGYIALPERKVNILPIHNAINLNDLLMMRLVLFDIDRGGAVSQGFAELLKFKNTFPSISDLFIKELELLIKKGLPISFRRSKQRGKSISGKIDYAKSMLLLKKRSTNPIVKSIDIPNLNNPTNWLLKKALRKIRLHIDPLTFNHLDAQLKVEIPKDLPDVKIARNAIYTSNCVQLAKMIINDLLPTKLNGLDWGETFLLNIDKVYEEFIYKILLFTKTDLEYEKPNKGISYGEYRIVDNIYSKKVLPDIFCKRAGILKGIVDAKNKFPKVFSNPDIYQMAFYSDYFGIKNIILAYPSNIDKERLSLNIYKNNSKIFAVFFNISSLSRGTLNKEIFRFSSEVDSLLS